MKIKRLIATAKMYLGRAMSYISIVNFGMILFVALNNLKENPFVKLNLNLNYWYPFIFIFTLCSAILFGKLEDWWGVHWEEKKASESRSYFLNEILTKLDKIEKEVEEIRERVK